MASFCKSKTFKLGRKLPSSCCLAEKTSSFFFVLMNVTSYKGVIVSLNFAAFVADRRKITMDKARNSNRVNSGVFSPLWLEKQATSWGEPEAYCGAGHCWLDERRIQVTFLIELFCVCFSMWHFLPRLA